MRKRTLFVLIILLLFNLSVYINAQNQNFLDIITLDWDRTGNRLAIGYEGGGITIVDIQLSLSFNVGRLKTTNVFSIDWHPTDDNLIAVGALDSGYRIYNVTTNEMLKYVEVGSTSVTRVIWNVDGTLIATAANWVRDNFHDPRVDIWDATTYELVASFPHSFFITDVQWHPTDPFKLASTAYDETTRFWDVNLGEEYRPLIPNNGGGTDIAWNFDGTQIAIAQAGNIGVDVGIWDISQNPEVLIREFDITDYINLAWKNDGTIAISEESKYHITDIEAREIFETGELTLLDSPEYVNALDWSVNGDLAVGGTDDTLLYFKPSTYYIVDEASDFTRFINMVNANTSMNVFDVRGDFELTEVLPDITGDITLIGNGAQIVMTGGSRIFNVTATGGLHLKNVTLSGGVADDGGAIYNAGDLTLENVILQNHSAVRGGAIYNIGSLVMNGGAIQNNSASQFGGGIYNIGDMQLDGVNIRENTAPEGSGVYQGE